VPKASIGGFGAWANRQAAVVFLATLLGAGAGCQTVTYYGQAIHGQCQVLNRQHSIDTLLADPATPAPLKSRLRLVLEIRRFAEGQLQLPANGHYLSYADLGRPFVVWNVSATPEFSLEAKTWWYPIVGRLEYRGYFAEQRARDYAARLAARGYDVHVGGVAAYSTLGWFRDPVLNTFINDPEEELADLLFHELAHQRVYVAGDTDFNESFATAVAAEGVRRWMESRQDSSAAHRHEQAARRTEQFVTLIANARTKLEAVYAAVITNGAKGECSAELPPDRAAGLRREKRRVIGELREDYQRVRAGWGGIADYDRWFSQDLNNAQLNSVDTYYQLVPAFQRLIRKHSGNMESFYAEVQAIGKLNETERHRRLAGD
jgi:predicted aminopeptidase